MIRSAVIGCHDCGLVQRLPAAPDTGGAACVRCGSSLVTPTRTNGLDRALALTVTGLILFVIANAFPFLVLEMKGQMSHVTLSGASMALYSQGRGAIATLVFATTVLAPGLLLILLAAVLTPLRTGKVYGYMPRLARLLPRLTPWVMVEVFVLSILVALVKLASMATVVLGVSLWAIGALMIVLSATLSNLDLHGLWERIEPLPHPAVPVSAKDRLLICGPCGLLNAPAAGSPPGQRCRRCGARLHRRKPNSLQRTWALLIAAMICYLPANLMPIMTAGYGGWYRSDTIMGGVFYMFFYDNWVLAVIIFLASIMVPLIKILILLFLLISVRLRSPWRPLDRTRLYRITEVIGKWSMVDIYVVTIMAALVNLGNFGFARAEPGAIFFGAVVVLTMIAAMSFDPRLIWDAAERNHGATS
jgi:paraquat-inducible protein A